VLPSPGTKCSDITDVIFGKKTPPTKRAFGHDDHELEKRLLEVEISKVFSKIKFHHAFRV